MTYNIRQRHERGWDHLREAVDEVALGSTDTREFLKKVVATIGYYTVMLPLTPVLLIPGIDK